MHQNKKAQFDESWLTEGSLTISKMQSSVHMFRDRQAFIETVRYIHQLGITLWPLTGEVNNTDYLFIMSPVSGWDMLGNKSTCCPQSWCVSGRKNGASIRISASLTRAKLWLLDDWARASPKLQLLWGVPGLQWSVSIKSGPSMEQCWTGDRVMAQVS